MGGAPWAYDFIVVGGGSAGCAVAGGLAERGLGRVLLIEAGPSDRWPLVRMPFGLVWLMGSKRWDWRFRSTPQVGANGRSLAIPRGKVLGGSGSINSMVWFRGRAADFDAWQIPEWSWSAVCPAFEAVEARVRPEVLAQAHPLSVALGGLFKANASTAPTPDCESAGVCRFNMRRGRRWSATDAFLRNHIGAGVTVLQSSAVARLQFTGDRVAGVQLVDGTALRAAKGVVLSAGTIGSPALMLQSGIGPAEDLRAVGQDVVLDAPGVGANLHDHPGTGVHFAGDRSGYGLHGSLAMQWMLAPFDWVTRGRGIFASPTVEACAFFNADGRGAPDIQSHFIPFYLDWQGRTYRYARGYFADAVVCRPQSRGALRLGRTGLEIDLGVFNDPADLDLLVRGWMRMRRLLAEADLGPHQAPEVYPAANVQCADEARAHIQAHCGTAYHPVGTLAMGAGDAPVTPSLQVKGVDGLWVADASVMPAITSANTNAPSMMIGYRAAQMIADLAA